MQRQNKNNAINEAYEAQFKGVNQKKTYEGKIRQKAAGSNAE